MIYFIFCKKTSQQRKESRRAHLFPLPVLLNIDGHNHISPQKEKKNNTIINSIETYWTITQQGTRNNKIYKILINKGRKEGICSYIMILVDVMHQVQRNKVTRSRVWSFIHNSSSPFSFYPPSFPIYIYPLIYIIPLSPSSSLLPFLPSPSTSFPPCNHGSLL